MAVRRRNDSARQDPRHLRVRPHRPHRRGLRQGVRDGSAGLGSETSRAAAQDDGFRTAASKKELFADVDVVSLHLRLVPATRGIVTRDDLRGMRPDSLLVNTSRAGLIETGALVAALYDGRPGRAAVDVFDTEPLRDVDDPLLRHPNVLATPHIGFVTREEYDLQFNDIYDQIIAYADGHPINVVNPAALDHPGERQ